MLVQRRGGKRRIAANAEGVAGEILRTRSFDSGTTTLIRIRASFSRSPYAFVGQAATGVFSLVQTASYLNSRTVAHGFGTEGCVGPLAKKDGSVGHRYL
jgi:hypothetical protein